MFSHLESENSKEFRHWWLGITQTLDNNPGDQQDGHSTATMPGEAI